MADRPKDQSEKFKEAARELGCDDSEEAFDEALKKVARHKPMDEKATPAKKRKVQKDR